MEVYYGLFLFIFLTGMACLHKRRPQKTVFFMLCGLAFSLAAAFRYDIGFDYRFYRAMFYQVQELPFASAMMEGTEAGFLLFMKGCTLVCGSYQVFLWIAAVLVLWSTFWFCGRYSPLPMLSVFLFLSLQMFACSMNLLRQSLAACCFLLAFPGLLERKPLRYFCFVLLGGAFHRSALVLIPFYWILRLELTPVRLIAFLLLAGTAYFAFDPIYQMLSPFLPEGYQKYKGSLYWGGNGVRYLVFPLLYQAAAAVYSVQAGKGDSHTAFCSCALWYCLFSIFITKHFVLERLSIYFSFAALVLLPEMVVFYGKKAGKGGKAAAYAAVAAVSVGYFLFAAGEGFHHVYPYYSIFDRAGGTNTSARND